MKISKLSAISAICIILISSSSSIIASGNNVEISSDLPESHTIQDVPYVGQETEIQCFYASRCMVLKYLGINASINETLYYSGIGHSLWCPSDTHIPFLPPALGTTMKTHNLLAEIYGLNHNVWKENSSFPKRPNWDEEWNSLWSWIKNKTSNDIPVIICVHETTLLTDNFELEIINKLLTKLPYMFMSHYIVITGYDESNNIVYYNDPAYGLFGVPDDGKYIGVDLTIFKSAVREAALSQPYNYEALVYENKTISPLTIDQAFNIANIRNIEKLKGNTSAYVNTDFDDSWDSDKLGINASIDLKKDFSKGLKNRIKTIYIYKLNNRLGLYYRFEKLVSFLPDTMLSLYDVYPKVNDAFRYVAVEKNNTLNYLKNIEPFLNQNNSIICNHQIDLLEQEVQNWTKIDTYYSQFKKKGVFLSLPYGIFLMNKMEETMDNIISIEEAIIAGPFEE